MNSSELLRLQLAKKLECSRIGYASGPTGPTGPAGNTGPTGPAGNTKIFTFFLDYSNPSTISRIYIPPGFSTDPFLINGGIFLAGTYGTTLQISGTSVTISSTKYNFPVGLSGTGYYNGGFWAPSPYASLGGTTGVRWRNVANVANLNTINLLNVSPLNLNGSNTSPKYLYLPGTTTPDATGWLATLTLYYL